MRLLLTTASLLKYLLEFPYMFDPSIMLFVAGLLVFASIIASRVSDRLGLPALLVFLVIGMLAGSDGPGGIQFENAETANLVGVIALAFILFSGGLDTNWGVIRPVLGRGVLLSTLGVAITAGLVGLFATVALGFSLPAGLLLGAIISSTDAAAVFSVLRGKGVGLKGNLRPLLELESGSNDPMAIFLTLGMTQLLTEPDFSVSSLVPSFLLNMVVGVAAGFILGRLAGLILNRIRLDFEGLYPVLTMSLVLLTFGAAEALQGNGFLAVYVCGIILNGADFVYKRAVVKFHDGLAWLLQIGMFLVLGLLVFPSQLPQVVFMSLATAAFLMFVARPVAVAIGLAGSSFTKRERLLVSWTGLRGAVPIVLATFPLMAGYEHSILIFDVVFFIVLTSVLVQGSLLMPVARLLKVDEPMASRPSFSLAIERRGQTQGATREIEIQPNMPAVGKTIADLEVPPEVLILLIGRGEGFVVPRGQTKIEPYDTLLMLGHEDKLKEAHKIVLAPTPVKPAPAQVEVDPLASLPAATEEKYLRKQAIVVGYGRVGRQICSEFSAQGIPYVVVDESRTLIEALRAKEVPAVLGDASIDLVLAQAHVARAALLIIATPDTMKVRKIAEIARKINPALEIVIRSHSEMEAHLLEQERTGKIFLGEHVLAKSIAAYAVEKMRISIPSNTPPAPENDSKA